MEEGRMGGTGRCIDKEEDRTRRNYTYVKPNFEKINSNAFTCIGT